MNTKDLEALIKDPTILNVICCQVEQFQKDFNAMPELVVITLQAKPAFAKELINLLKINPFEAILEPVWLSGIPIIFAKSKDFMHLTNKRIGKELIL